MVIAVGHHHSGIRKAVIKKFKNMSIRQELNSASQVTELHCFTASNLQIFYEKWANITSTVKQHCETWSQDWFHEKTNTNNIPYDNKDINTINLEIEKLLKKE